ncbi:2-amino-4-hydroxy-6-hydroxymethyldihydropteridine diphosphokinase [Salinibacterium sp.]|uniref:2-amino-4-hydroxy-6- hydroxymethyldihydropteridine diphosphokinase n=1 Tax=Salinibacterium sp. TaxID=1915057 RepID=UPI00286C6A4B|nr:2-amino-4-hydroxy-6-hydroxymethyldihydropteridine diphosphokinase [Salinibacterium sp.]
MIEHPAVLALGSNLGDRELTLRQAVRDISALDGIVLVAASGIVETTALKPDGVDPDAPPYLNAVVTIRTTFEPRALLAAVNAIEAGHGRVRDIRWGDRTLDIDIISFGTLELDLPELTIPHPRAADRAFVLAPWAQIEPNAIIVGRGRITDLLEHTEDRAVPYPSETLL